MTERRCRVCRGWHDVDQPWPNECAAHNTHRAGESSPLSAPYVAGDISPYMSPLGTGEVSSRSHRREDLKRGGCREVDPSERPNFGRPVRPRGHSKMNPEQLAKATQQLEAQKT